MSRLAGDEFIELLHVTVSDIASSYYTDTLVPPIEEGCDSWREMIEAIEKHLSTNCSRDQA